MNRHSIVRALLLASALGLSGCGVSYVSPLVSERSRDGVTVVA